MLINKQNFQLKVPIFEGLSVVFRIFPVLILRNECKGTFMTNTWAKTERFHAKAKSFYLDTVANEYVLMSTSTSKTGFVTYTKKK